MKRARTSGIKTSRACRRVKRMATPAIRCNERVRVCDAMLCIAGSDRGLADEKVSGFFLILGVLIMRPFLSHMAFVIACGSDPIGPFLWGTICGLPGPTGL